MTSIRPEAIREPRLAGGRSSATASPVTRSSAVRLAKAGPEAGHRRQHRLSRVDLDAYVLAHARRVAAARGAHRRRAARPAPRATSWSTSTSRSRPTSRSCVRRHPTPRWSPTCPRCWREARHPTVGTRVDAPGAASGGFFTDRFPAALYRLRWWWLGTLAANVVVTGGDDLVAARPPGGRADHASPAEIDQLVSHDFEDYYSEYAASPLRRPGLDQQRLGRGALHRARRPRAARWSSCCSTTSPTWRSSARS